MAQEEDELYLMQRQSSHSENRCPHALLCWLQSSCDLRFVRLIQGMFMFIRNKPGYYCLMLLRTSIPTGEAEDCQGIKNSRPIPRAPLGATRLQQHSGTVAETDMWGKIIIHIDHCSSAKTLNQSEESNLQSGTWCGWKSFACGRTKLSSPLPGDIAISAAKISLLRLSFSSFQYVFI